jgi:ribosomal subunit interface protein
MDVPLQVTFRGFPHSHAVDADIRDHIAKLEEFYDRIISCRVVVQTEHHSHHQGNLFRVSIDLSVPGRELAVSRDQHDRQEHEDVYVAIRDAFDAMRRQLEDFSRRQRGDVKRHESPGEEEP